ncbi:hypothetical protein CDAR_581131 [Caerostris darwini]|uniref:C2H2-type domain-containing protein n=1 Tax=Caerostris darwini TaxID=1538125 RepID=A0AAV4WIQ0_9ARAC|nr:hypothetical protein CDAR_581131 [Caerostris darwini]
MLASHTFPTTKLWKCYVCGRIFTNLEQLKEHCPHQHPDLPYVCDLCGRAQYLSEFKRRLLVHTGERHHVCQHCREAFGRKDNLNRHKKTHKEKP